MTDPQPTARDLLAHLESQRGAMTEWLGALVSHESPSDDKPALDALCVTLARRFQEIADEVVVLPNPEGGDHLHVRFGPPDAPAPSALVIGHFDTVWPFGTQERLPFRVEGPRVYGPGVYDMKAGLVLAWFALAACRGLGLRLPRPVELFLGSDEEIGSRTSRRLIESHARRAAYALVLEPPLADGSLKTARKGVGAFTLEVTGCSAHAGVEPEKGINAVVELAHQVLAIQSLADPARGTTLNVGVIEGGTKSNVVPARASARVDARVTTSDEAGRVQSAMLGLRPVLAGARLRVTGGFGRPPMERTPAIAELFARAREVGRTLGLELTEGSTGGGSDGNFTAALGVPTLDGLGVPGDGAHADHEHILADHLPTRAALLAALLLTL